MKEGSHVSDYDRAIADYNEAIRIDPKVAFRNRGLVFFYSGDFEEASAALLLANDLKDDAHAMLALSWACAPGQDGAAELSNNATRQTPRTGPSSNRLLSLAALARRNARSASNANEQCESAFFAGERQLLHGNKVEARALLQVAVGARPKTFVEYSGAISELKWLRE
jgi:lipoprotein NlpI